MMPFYRSLIKPVAALLIVALLAVAGVRSIRGPGAPSAAALAADTLEAAADSTRHIHMKDAALGDSLQLVERRAVQAEQKADALDRALALERVARDRLEVRIARLARVVRSDTLFIDRPAGTDEIRRAEFRLREAPYTIGATVALPPPPGRGTMDVKVEVDTLGLELRLGCGPPNGLGVRRATASVVAPAWAAVRLDRVEQLPSVCARSSPEQSSGFANGWRHLVSRVGFSVGYAATRQASGAVVAGPALLFGVRVWP